MKIFNARKVAAVVAGLVLLGAAAGLALRGCGESAGPQFASVTDFACWADTAGLHVHGTHVGSDPYAVLVSDRPGPQAFEGSTFNAPREGVITVMRLHPSTPRPRQPHRVWGQVVAYGDATLLAKVEALRAADD